MLSGVQRTRFTEIPANAEVIDLGDDEEIQQDDYSKQVKMRCEEKIQTAILTKSLDEMKKAIFTCLVIKRLNNTTQKADKIISQNYIKYFKEKLNISIANECYNPRHQVPDPMADINPRQIIVHGVDFMTNIQIQNKFKGLHGVTVQRINSSNASVKFSQEENVQNILEMERYGKGHIKDVQVIQNDTKFEWKMLKKYDTLGFERLLKYRMASVQEQNFPTFEMNVKKFEVAKNAIHLSQLFIQSNDDKAYFDEQMHKFQQSLRPRYHRSNKSRSEYSQSSHNRERTRDNRNFRRQQGGLEIDGFRGRFDDRRQGRQREGRSGGRQNYGRRRQYNNDGDNGRQNNGYRTQRYNNYDDRRNESFTDRKRFDGNDRYNNNQGNGFRKNRYNQNQQNGENMRKRQNRFFDNRQQQNGKHRKQRENSSKSIQMQQNQKKSVSKSRSNSSKQSYGLNRDINIKNSNNPDLSMSLNYGDRLNNSIRTQKMNNQQSMIDQSFALNDNNNLNNLSLFNQSNNNAQNVSMSMIIPQNTCDFGKKVQQDDESVGDILQKIDAENHKRNDERKQSRSRSLGSKKNSSVRSKRSKNSSMDWDENKNAQQDKKSRGSKRSSHNNNNSNNNRRGNRDCNNSNYNNQDNNNINRYNGRNNENNYNNNNNNRANNYPQREYNNSNNNNSNNGRSTREYNNNNNSYNDRGYNSNNNDRRSGGYNNNSNMRNNNNNFQRRGGREGQQDNNHGYNNNNNRYNNNNNNNSNYNNNRENTNNYNNKYNNDNSRSRPISPNVINKHLQQQEQIDY